MYDIRGRCASSGGRELGEEFLIEGIKDPNDSFLPLFDALVVQVCVSA